MAFHWADEAGYRSQEFPTQADAEAWLTASYEELLDEGVLALTLFSDDHPVYGPMSLEA